jgi:hypothetical protein
MKDLLSPRFSVNAKEGYSDFTQNQVEYINRVRRKILNGFTLKANNCPCGEGNRDKDIVISEIDRYGLPLQTVLCVKCGTLRIDTYLDDKSLSEFYTDYYQQMYEGQLRLTSILQSKVTTEKNSLSLQNSRSDLEAISLSLDVVPGEH